MWTKYDTFTPSQKKAEYERLKKTLKTRRFGGLQKWVKNITY